MDCAIPKHEVFIEDGKSQGVSESRVGAFVLTLEGEHKQEEVIMLVFPYPKVVLLVQHCALIVPSLNTSCNTIVCAGSTGVKTSYYRR